MAVRGGHVRCVLTDASGNRLRAVAWRAEDTELGRRLLSREGALHVAGRLKPDDWKGREGVELEIEDAADPRRIG
jgi:single-stranded-DNA-specific exonuclease